MTFASTSRTTDRSATATSTRDSETPLSIRMPFRDQNFVLRSQVRVVQTSDFPIVF